MTFAEFRTSEPELANRLVEACSGDVSLAATAWATWVAEGVQKERLRCASHLVLAARSGNRKLAYDAIVAGRPIDDEAKLEHARVATGWGARLIMLPCSTHKEIG